MHSAHYDSDGNIILDTDSAFNEEAVRVPVTIVSEQVQTAKSSGWTMVPEQPLGVDRKSLPKTKPTDLGLKTTAKQIVSANVHEGALQMKETAAEMIAELQKIKGQMSTVPKRMKGMLSSFWKNANAEVRLPAFQKRNKKPPTKLKLFVLDTIRFGGTFAGIFVVLFVAINFQSFFQIARAELALQGDLKTQQGLAEIVSGSTTPTDGTLESLDLNSSSAVLGFLPSVGPYEDRLIIPKLGENVPIVKPSMNALMREDWKQFENDIQSALHDGVVHYPGSARPGQAGNFFLTGHSSYYPWDDGKYKNVFARLKELDTGDTYSVYYGGDKHTYRVTGKKEVRPTDTTVLDQPTNKRIATLMTCTPVGTTLRRLIVMAEEIDPLTGEILAVGDKSAENQAMPTARLDSLPI